LNAFEYNVENNKTLTVLLSSHGRAILSVNSVIKTHGNESNQVSKYIYN